MKRFLSRARAWLATVPAKARVVVNAWPAWAAAGTAGVTWFATSVVPLLPGPWAVRALGVAAAVTAGIAAVSAAVARVTPVLFPQNRGLLAPPPAQYASGGVISRGDTYELSETQR